MPAANYRDTAFIFDFRRREFLKYTRVEPDGRRISYWTPSMRYAKLYKNPSNAQRMARLLNLTAEGQPCQAVSSAAAECLDMINQRGNIRKGD